MLGSKQAVQSDTELVNQVLAGDVQAYASLVERYERLARAEAMQSVRDHHTAEDVAQEAFVVAYQTLRALRDHAKFGPWLLEITKRRASQHARRRKVAPVAVSVLDGTPSSAPERNGQLHEDSEFLLALVNRLPEHERIVVGLRHFEEHSVQEIAQITGRPVGTVTKQLSRAIERLRKWCERELS